MNWILLLCLIAVALCPIMGEDFDSGFDFTSKYAELAAPAPANIDLDELVASLRAASNFP